MSVGWFSIDFLPLLVICILIYNVVQIFFNAREKSQRENHAIRMEELRVAERQIAFEREKMILILESSEVDIESSRRQMLDLLDDAPLALYNRIRNTEELY